jgi:hypothetical protein
VEWRKSSKSNSEGNCVEFRRMAGVVQIRDSKDQTGPTLALTLGEWTAFVGGVKDGEFDL